MVYRITLVGNPSYRWLSRIRQTLGEPYDVTVIAGHHVTVIEQQQQAQQDQQHEDEQQNQQQEEEPTVTVREPTLTVEAEK